MQFDKILIVPLKNIYDELGHFLKPNHPKLGPLKTNKINTAFLCC